MRGPASRRRALTAGLMTLCATLAVLAFVPPPPPDTAPGPAGRVAVAPLNGAETAGTVLRPVDVNGPAFQRPIFVASRRLPGGRGRPAGAAAVEGMKLTAVFLGPDLEKALVTGTGAKDGIWVRPGQSLRGWRIEEIRAESIVLAAGNDRRTLELVKPESGPRRPARTRKRPRRMPVRPTIESGEPGAAGPEQKLE